MVYQEILGIPIGTNCAPLIADMFLFCYERDFMSNLHKSKRYDLIDMFNDTSRYLGDIFTIDNREFEKHFPDIYPTELQLNKANTSDKETFLDLNIKVMGSDVHTSVYDKRDDFGFPIVNFPWLSGDVHRLQSYVFTFLSWLDFLGVALAFRISILKIFNLLPNYYHRITYITRFEKTLGKFFMSYSDLLSKFGEISFQEYVTEGISRPVFYGDLYVIFYETNINMFGVPFYQYTASKLACCQSFFFLFSDRFYQIINLNLFMSTYHHFITITTAAYCVYNVLFIESKKKLYYCPLLTGSYSQFPLNESKFPES